MAETALSIATSVLGTAIGKAATAAAEKMSMLMGVQKEIWSVVIDLPLFIYRLMRSSDRQIGTSKILLARFKPENLHPLADVSIQNSQNPFIEV